MKEADLKRRSGKIEKQENTKETEQKILVPFSRYFGAD